MKCSTERTGISCIKQCGVIADTS